MIILSSVNAQRNMSVNYTKTFVVIQYRTAGHAGPVLTVKPNLVYLAFEVASLPAFSDWYFRNCFSEMKAIKDCLYPTALQAVCSSKINFKNVLQVKIDGRRKSVDST